MLPGGVGEACPATEEVQALVDSVREDFEAKTGKHYPLFTAVLYRSQVVAGTNYFVKVRVGDDDYVHLRILKYLPNIPTNPQLHGFLLNKTKDDVVEYFE